MFYKFIGVYLSIVDYTREDYLLLENGRVAIYNDYGRIFHVTNLTYYKEILEETQTLISKQQEFVYILLNTTNDNYPSEKLDEKELDSLDLEIELLDSLLKEFSTNDRRYKRGINEIGTLWKWIAGTPDHDDFVQIN